MTARGSSHRDRIESELRTNILPFWIQHAPDRRRGGFFGEISSDLVVSAEAPRGALLSSRILWAFAAAWRRYGESACLEMAKRAWDDLEQRFWDREHGGYYWLVSADGTPLRPRKQTYGQAFGIYALAEYHRATGERAPLDRAIELHHLLEQHSRDRRNGGYVDAFTRDWKPESDQRLSELDLNEPKSQNTHLHIIEAYTNLFRAWPDAALKRDLAAVVEVLVSRILLPPGRHLGLFFSEDWRLRSDRISFGHDIEASWLLTAAAATLGDAALIKRCAEVSLSLVRATLEEGVDADGAINYEAGPAGITNSDREWWPQAEAAVGFVDAWQLSGDRTFLRAAWRVWDFIEANLVDREHGEWFHTVTRERVVRRERAKVSFWKCPYHNSRACLELLERLPPESSDER